MARQASHTPHKPAGRAKPGRHPEVQLLAELETFERKLPQLLETSAGKYVVIKRRDVLGISNDYAGALRLGYDRLGSDTPFFVEQIEDPNVSAKRNKVFLTKLEWLK